MWHLFIDLKSAFDTIDHSILIEKLDHYGVRGKALELLSSYLKGRRQFVKGDDVESMILNVLCADLMCKIWFLGGERGSYGVGCRKEQDRALTNNKYIG